MDNRIPASQIPEAGEPPEQTLYKKLSKASTTFAILRQEPYFSTVELDELVTLAANVRDNANWLRAQRDVAESRIPASQIPEASEPREKTARLIADHAEAWQIAGTWQPRSDFDAQGEVYGEQYRKEAEAATRELQEHVEQLTVIADQAIEIVQDCRKSLGLPKGSLLTEAVEKLAADRIPASPAETTPFEELVADVCAAQRRVTTYLSRPTGDERRYQEWNAQLETARQSLIDAYKKLQDHWDADSSFWRKEFQRLNTELSRLRALVLTAEWAKYIIAHPSRDGFPPDLFAALRRIANGETAE